MNSAIVRFYLLGLKMRISAPIVYLKTLPDMATAAIHSDDPRYLMEKLRGQELHFDGQSVGLIVVPYIDR